MRVQQIIIVFLHFLLLTQLLQAQESIFVSHSCSFDGKENNEEYFTFEASTEAYEIVAEIVNAFSLSKNFIVKSANCKNALATIEGKQRYILYNTTFLENFKKESNTRWAAYCVLAHEIGHHLNYHDFEVIDPKKRKIMELEADKFAGGVLFILGATLEDSKAGIDILQNKEGNDTHPPASARAEAIASGWKNSQTHYKKIQDPDLPTIKNEYPRYEIFTSNSGVFSDYRDGNNYTWIRLKDGTIWMNQNLNLKTTTSHCYNNSQTNCATYGQLYSWEDAQKACPTGWRLPKIEDWQKLAEHYGGYFMPKIPRYNENHGKNIGDPKIGFLTMMDPKGEFRGLLGGVARINKGDVPVFNQKGVLGYYWSSTSYETGTNGHGALHFAFTLFDLKRPRALVSYGYTKNSAFSVRCVK